MNNKFYTYSYSGWDTNGQWVRAYMHAEHILIAKHNLATQGILIKKIHRAFMAPRLHFNAQDLLLMTQQLTVLIHAALPIVFCLKTLAKQFKPMMRDVFNQMIMTIEQGKTLSAALNRYSHIFPHYFIYLIQVGEESGQLGPVLVELSNYQKKMLDRAQQVKKALLYPVFIFVISIIITMALLLFIVPQFQLLFADAASTLPTMTRFVFTLSDVLQQLRIMHIFILLLLLFGLFYFFRNNEYGVRFMQEMIYRLPFIGPLLHDNQQTRYLRSLSVALQAGLPLMQALQLANEVLQNTRLSGKIAQVPARIQSGTPLTQAFSQTAQFCEIVIQLIAIGEQTSQLSTLLAQSAQILEQRVDQLIEQITRLLQPTLIVFLGIILGGLIIALYLPVFKLGTLY